MKSMTGYGASEGKVGDGVLFVEIKSVNSRFLDVNCKLPPKMNPIESKIRRLVQDNVVRGKVEVFLKDKREFGDPYELCLNWNLARQYKRCLSELTKTLGLEASSHLLEVVDLKELVTFYEKPIAFNRLWGQIEQIIIVALKKFEQMRVKEGSAIKRDQIKRLSLLTRLIGSIEKKSRARTGEYRNKLRSKILENNCSGLDPQRLESEVAIQTDRTDVTEEIIRLQSHVSQYRSLVTKSGAIGRQIDFLLQEMHREINTLGSKANDGDISRFVVSAKSELEKLREQVQNVE